MGSFSLEEWLEQIDPTMKEYANNLEKFGFGSLKTLRNIDSDINNYLPEMLPGHKKALLEETKKLITSVKVYNETDSSTVADTKCNKRQKQLDFGTNISGTNKMVIIIPAEIFQCLSTQLKEKFKNPRFRKSPA